VSERIQYQSADILPVHPYHEWNIQVARVVQTDGTVCVVGVRYLTPTDRPEPIPAEILNRLIWNLSGTVKGWETIIGHKAAQDEWTHLRLLRALGLYVIQDEESKSGVFVELAEGLET